MAIISCPRCTLDMAPGGTCGRCGYRRKGKSAWERKQEKVAARQREKEASPRMASEPSRARPASRPRFQVSHHTPYAVSRPAVAPAPKTVEVIVLRRTG